MAYNQKQNAGRGNMPKTGRDIPLNMKSPAYMTDGPGDKKGKPKQKQNSDSSPKQETHIQGYQPLSKKGYVGDNSTLAGQVATLTNRPKYVKDSIAHRKADLKLNTLKPGSRVPGTKYIINDFNNETQSFEARLKGTLKKVSIPRRNMRNRLKGTGYPLNETRIDKFKKIRSGTNDGF